VNLSLLNPRNNHNFAIKKSNVDETCSPRPLATNGKQVQARNGHKFGMKKTWKTKKSPLVNNLSVDEDINF
jgi:hypothetical protein